MNITAEEKMMYGVMKAIYDSGIPISFKGSMVLKAYLMQAGFTDETRHTVDIDANWQSDTEPTQKQMIDSMKNALEKAGINLNIELYRMYGEHRSAGFELSDPNTGDILFTIDMDVNRARQDTQLYVVEGFVFQGITPSQMLADKITAISSDTVFRRIKDVIDLYYLSHVIPLDKVKITHAFQNTGRYPSDFDGFLNEPETLKHAYEKFRFAGNVYKPSFDNIYTAVKEYIFEILPKD